MINNNSSQQSRSCLIDTRITISKRIITDNTNRFF